VLLGAGALLVVAAYSAAARKNVDGTTEVAALVVLAAGFTAGLGLAALASAIIAVTALLLVEKSRLHDLVARLDCAPVRDSPSWRSSSSRCCPMAPSVRSAASDRGSCGRSSSSSPA
jgi:hypothetical protein